MEYTICERQKPGWTNTDPGTIDPDTGEPCLTQVLTTGQGRIDVFFGNVEPDTYELRLIKYNDLDEDGTNNEVNTAPGSGLSGNALTGWEFVVYNAPATKWGATRRASKTPEPTAISAFAPRFRT